MSLENIELQVPTMAEMAARGETPDVLFWVGCAGSFDEKAQRITRAFAKILTAAKVKFAVLGAEEGCTGDPARRAGNEFLFQMMAANNLNILNGYNIKRIVTACPHCFHTLKNEYPELGGHFDVMHHSVFLQQLIDEGRIVIKEGGAFKGKKITYHDSCYLGRANDIYEAPRSVLARLDAELVEMPRSRQNGFCCGAGGAQVFKEEEPGRKEVYTERIEEAISVQPDIVASACPYCKLMLTSGAVRVNKDNLVIKDIAELIVNAADIA